MALRRSAVRIRYAPGFVKQRIRVPDTLFFYAIRVGVASEH